VVDSTTNRVGIGTGAPTDGFHVVGSSTFDGGVHINSSQGVQFPDSLTRIWAESGDLNFAASEDIYITHDGSLYVDIWSQTFEVDSVTNRVGIGTYEADEKLHVEDSTTNGLAFLKLQTSHATEWGETGIRWETPQNRWHLRMDDYGNNNIPEGALGLRCNTPGHELMTWTEDGMVGVGNTQPSAKLDVVGDLELSGAYRGSIGPNNGAPFPRPAFDSGWVAMADGGDVVTLTHGLGGDRDDYVVDLQFHHVLTGGGSLMGVHNMSVGGDDDGASEDGAFWTKLTSTSIDVIRHSGDAWADEIRVRIWVVN